MEIQKVCLKARIKCATAYYEDFDSYHVLKLQLMYDNNPNIMRNRYQVITFKFLGRNELIKCVKVFKSSLGIKRLADIKDNEAEVQLYMEGKDATSFADAELMAIMTPNDRTKAWFPIEIGLSGELKDHQTIFSYED